MSPWHFSFGSRPRALGIMTALLLLSPGFARGQITPQQAAQIQNAIGNRIEALTILGGDFGLAGGLFRSRVTVQGAQSTDTQLQVGKLGGAGDVGDIRPLGDLSIGWQPRVQGNMGAVTSTNHLHGMLEGDTSTFEAKGIEFGGGARFWVNDQLSFAPTIMALYGHTTNTYTAVSAFMQANLDRAVQAGLVNYNVDTITVRTASDVQYLVDWGRTIVTLTMEPVWFHTESLSSSNSNVKVNGDSGTLAGIIDVDIPLRHDLFGHELRTGGYYRHTLLFGGLESGLDMSQMNELHGRIVLDFLNQLWKVQWLGIGVSYLWGSNINGWSGGLDATFRF